ncbi:MAG: DUF1190 domain-containing protein [Hyphomicrobiaceae bacterium]|nr:DUF1190 domain-containing protein [Hyphomicrobiaceae bacterium]
MKRSRKIALISMGVSTLALAACEEAKTEASIFRTVAECVQSGQFTAKQCEHAQAYAISEHDMAAPRYKTKEDCEAVAGKGQCEHLEGTRREPGTYRPGIAAFMFAASRSVYPQPLYRKAGSPGQFTTADGRRVPARIGRVTIPQSAAARPTSKIHTATRSGFGSTTRSFSTTGRS